jgi:3',5'-nucleoside bisphosphate phosphatase
MNRDIVADLHMHTNASDGELTPEDLVRSAAATGLKIISVTDHDTIAGLERASAEATKHGIEVIPGCELTVYEGEIELHVLALFFDRDSESFAELLAKMQKARRERAFKMAEKLSSAGFKIEVADIEEAAGRASSIGRPHVAAALVKLGHAPSMNVAQINLLSEGKVGHVPKFKLPPEEAFSAVHDAGGICILAHPGQRPHDELIAPLFRRGLDGVEALYAMHSEINRRYYSGLARRYEKQISGGSDFHGPHVRPNARIGDGGVDRATLAQLRRAAEKRREAVLRP